MQVIDVAEEYIIHNQRCMMAIKEEDEGKTEDGMKVFLEKSVADVLVKLRNIVGSRRP